MDLLPDKGDHASPELAHVPVKLDHAYEPNVGRDSPDSHVLPTIAHERVATLHLLMSVSNEALPNRPALESKW
jgi:hypothetical protein